MSEVMIAFLCGVLIGAAIPRLLDVFFTLLLHLTGEIKNFPPENRGPR